MKLRSERDNLLLSSDFTQLGDIGLSESKKTEWINYRQALRDITKTASPKLLEELPVLDLSSVTFPTKPS